MKVRPRFGRLLLLLAVALAGAWLLTLSLLRPFRKQFHPHNTHQPPSHSRADKSNYVPSNRRPEKAALVIGRLSHENASWAEAFEHITPYVYTVNGNRGDPGLRTPMNKGREALPYLTYLVDNYHSLASTIIFMHAHEAGFPQAWHVDTPEYSNVESIQMLNFSYVQHAGYVNLRCNPTPGCPDEMLLDRQPKDPDLTAELEMPAAWAALMGAATPLPAVIAQPCCAQFAVSREQVLRRPWSDYQRYYTWLTETTLPDDISGRIMEYMWHIIFGREEDGVFCQDQEQCYCYVFGACSMYDGPPPP